MKKDTLHYMHLFWSIIVVTLFTVALMTGSVFAENKVYSRDSSLGDPNASSADDVTVTLIDNGDEASFSAEVSGTGAMKDYMMYNQVPWSSYRNKITSVKVTGNVTHIGDCAFDRAAINTITLSDNLKTIGDRSFGNNNAEEIVIPKNVESFMHTSFGGTDNIILVKGNNTKFEDEPKTVVGKKVVAYEDSYIALNWKDSYLNNYQMQMENRNVLEIVSSYKSDPDNISRTIEYVANGSDIVIPERFSIIGSNTFDGNAGLTSVDLNKVTSIESNAFYGCSDLKTVFIPKTVEIIADTAFAGCGNLETIYGNADSAAESFAENNGISFVVLKPYRKDGVNAVCNYELTVGDVQKIDLSSVFDAQYDTELKYQVKIDDGDYQDIDGAEYVFDAAEEGEVSLVFCAVDSFGEVSDDTYTINYDVINNSIPVLNPEKKEFEYVALMGEQFRIDLSDVFTDADDDSLYYMWTEPEDGEVDWDEDPIRLTMIPGTEAFDIPVEWTNSLDYSLGQERSFYIKAYDEYDKPSDDYYEIRIRTHSVDVIVSKGEGVRSLDDIKFSFECEDAETVTSPVEIVDNHYYFDLDYEYSYNSAREKVFEDSLEYSYTVSLGDCIPVNGTYYTDICERDENTIEVTLVNPAQVAKDAEDVAATIALIDAIGDVTLESEEAVTAAQKAYDDLYDDLKPQVTNYNALLQARLTLADLKLAAAKTDLEKAEKAKEKADQDKKDAEAKIQTAEDEVKEAKAELAGVKEELAAMKLTVKGLKVTSKKKKFTVKWKKNAKASGYTVQYKLSGAKKFKTLKTLAKTKVVTKKLKKGKKYEFRVATYKKVNGKKVFGKWSEAKIVKCK